MLLVGVLADNSQALEFEYYSNLAARIETAYTFQTEVSSTTNESPCMPRSYNQPASQSTNQRISPVQAVRPGSPGQPTAMQSMYCTSKQTNKSHQQPPLHTHTNTCGESYGDHQPSSSKYVCRQTDQQASICATSFTASAQQQSHSNELFPFSIDFTKWLLMSCAYKNNKHYNTSTHTSVESGGAVIESSRVESSGVEWSGKATSNHHRSSTRRLGPVDSLSALTASAVCVCVCIVMSELSLCSRG